MCWVNFDWILIQLEIIWSGERIHCTHQMPHQKINAALLILACEDGESFFMKELILTRCLKWSTKTLMICHQFKIRFLWHMQEGESFYVKDLLYQKFHMMNLFTTWEIGVPKVGAPWSLLTSLGPLYIWDVPYSLVLCSKWCAQGPRDQG